MQVGLLSDKNIDTEPKVVALRGMTKNVNAKSICPLIKIDANYLRGYIFPKLLLA